MSRSCQSAMSSNAACALARTTRARPQICSQVTGLRLCGIAELPFCPSAKYSSASRTSVRCRWRTSSAIFSQSAVTSASAATNAAWRSRWITCEATGAGFRSEARADALFGFRADVRRRCRRRPRSCRRAGLRPRRRRRARLRPASSYQMASFSPKVMGSAWTPCVRPICTVCWNSSARRFSTSRSCSRSRDAGSPTPAAAAAPARYRPRRWRSGRSGASATLRRVPLPPWSRPPRW